MKTIAVIQARMGSERFPGKILAPLCGEPMLKVLVSRLHTELIDEWWLATTEEAKDNLTAEWGKALGLRVFRGSTEDVLSRFTRIIEIAEPDWVFRLTGDNPFMHRDVLTGLHEAAQVEDSSTDMIRYQKNHGIPLGFASVSLTRGAALLRASNEISDEEFHHRIHVTSWTYEHGITREIDVPSGWQDRRHWRWTIDTKDDYEMAQKAFELFVGRWRAINYPEMVKELDNWPEITQINQHMKQKNLEQG